MKLGRSFFSLYFIIIITFILFSWLLDEGWRSYLEQDVESYTGYKVMLEALGTYIENNPEQQWQELVANISNKFEVPLSLLPLTSLKQLDLNKDKTFKTGNTFVYYADDDVYLYHLLNDTRTLLTLGPAKMPTRPRLEALIRAGIMAVFGLLILVWLWPISKDLDGLRASAEKLGEGDFTAKAPKAKSEMMASMVHTFNMMAGRIKRLIDAHKELTNGVAHELRTPLARSKFALQMLDLTDDPDKQRRYKQQITNDVIELEELINEMLLYASFDSDKPVLKFSSVNIKQLIHQQLNSYDSTELELSFIDEAGDKDQVFPVDCDSHFITRALVNYLVNAKKYGQDKIQVTLSVEQGNCTICVEDNGQGISNEFKPVIFDAFSRGDNSRNRETGGFGLGLAIVSRIMEWHQGKAWVEDSPLGGASFYLSWPISQSI